MSDNSIDVNSNKKANSNSKQVIDNNNSEEAADRYNKYNEKVKEIRTLKRSQGRLKMH